MEYRELKPDNAHYPRRLLERLGDAAPVIYAHGPLRLLDRFTMAVACSDLIPGLVFRATHDALFAIREFAINYIGGWHSVMETEIFRLALDRTTDEQGLRSLSLVTSRGLARENWEQFLNDRFGYEGPFTGFPEKEEYYRRARQGELLMLSVTDPEYKRMTRKNIMARNWLACALADVVFIPFADKGSKTYLLCKRALEAGLPVFTVEHEENADIMALGVRALTRKTAGAYFEQAGARREGEPPFPPQAFPARMTVPPETAVPSPGRKKAKRSGQMSLWAKDSA